MMTDVERIVLPDEAPKVDAVEQHRTVDSEDDIGLDASYVDDVDEREANPADVIDQAIVVPDPED